MSSASSSIGTPACTRRTLRLDSTSLSNGISRDWEREILLGFAMSVLRDEPEKALLPPPGSYRRPPPPYPSSDRRPRRLLPVAVVDHRPARGAGPGAHAPRGTGARHTWYRYG